MNNKNYLLIALLSVFLLAQLSTVQATTSETNYTVSSGNSATPQFVVQSLQYSPAPVSAGDWFDIWVKAENIGTDNAPNAEFQLVPSYPFQATDNLVQDFGVVPGTWAAHANQASLGDSTSQTNIVLMKFRVLVADNAPVGESLLQIKATPDKSGQSAVTYNLPITIGKTKTDFTVVTQSATSGLSFSIANTGENPATAVTVSIPQQPDVISSGTSSSIIGNLAGGDFTTVSFQSSLRPSARNISVDIAYTDIAGVRNTVEENISIDSLASQTGGLNVSAGGRYGNFSRNGATAQSSTPTWILYVVIGAVIGAGAVFLINRRKHGKNETK